MMDDGDISLDFRRLFNPLSTKKVVWIIVLVGVVVHFNGLFGGFIGDDKGQIQFNHFIQSLSHVPQFFTGSTFASSSGTNLDGPFYKPFLSLSYAVLYALFKATPFYFHAFQLILHITNGILLFILFKKFLKEHIALLLALIFIVHPINSEAVVYIADLQEPLFFCFGLSALLLAMKESLSPKRAALISLLLLCSLLSKETGILFVLMVIITRLFVRWYKTELLRSMMYAIPPILIYAFLRFGVAKMFISKFPGMPITLLPLSQRILNMPAIVFYYLKTFFYPSTLDFFQIWIVKRITLTNFFVPLIAIGLFFAALILLGVYTYRKYNSLFLPYLFFTIWLLAGIGLHMQLVPLDFTVSERWFYFPIVGLLGVLGVAWQAYSGKSHPKQYLTIALGVLAVLTLTLFSVRTMVRNANWTNEITLYSHDIAIYDSSFLENNLGQDYFAKKDYQQAVIHYQKSVNIDPSLGSYYNIALVYMDTGDLKNAELYYLKALAANKTQPDHEDYKLVGNKIFEDLTSIHIVSREYMAAEQLASKAIAMYPHDGLLWGNLAVSQYMQGEKVSARHAITTALIQLPDNNEIQYAYQQITTNQPIQIGK